MKSISAAAVAIVLASSQGAVADTVIPWIYTDTVTNNACNTTLTVADLVEPCGTQDKPCAMITSRNDTTISCNKIYKLAYSYDKAFNVTMYAKVIDHNGALTADFGVTPMGWKRMCPFQCESPAECKPHYENCTASNTKPNFIDGGYMLPGSATANVNALTIQFQSLNADGTNGDDKSDNVTLVHTTHSFNDTTIIASNWTNTDIPCTGQSFDLSSAITNTNCGSAFAPCPVMSKLPCGSTWKLFMSVPGVGDAAFCADNKCPTYIVERHVKVVRAAPDTQVDTFAAPQSLWTNEDGVFCRYMCKGPNNQESCVKDQQGCANGMLNVALNQTLGSWGEVEIFGSMNNTFPIPVSSIEAYSGAVSKVAMPATSAVALIIASLYA